MALGGHLGLRFSRLWDHRRISGAELMLNTKFGANRTNRFEVIQNLVNLSFSSAAILDFEKMAVLTLPVSGRCQDDRSSVLNLVRIGRTVWELFKFL